MTSDINVFDSAEFRRALGTFTTGVTIITTRDPSGNPVGVTANSFNSVSLDPPLVLWSLARRALSMSVFEQAEHWAVHILSTDQQSLSDRFARRGEDKFAQLVTEQGVGGVPLLDGCTSRFECRSTYRYEGGDHVIFVGEVVRFQRFAAAPLVFHRGGYAVATHRVEARPPGTEHAPESSFGEDFLDYLLPRAHFQIYDGIRRMVRRHDLSDAEWFVLSSLTARSGRSLEELAQMYAITGITLTGQAVERLLARSLLIDSAEGGFKSLHLTDTGRHLAVEVLSAAKAQEAEIVDRLGQGEAMALKSLLRELIRITDPGLPDMWGRSPAGS